MESDKNKVEIQIGRFTLCSDGKNWFIYEVYMGKDKHKQPKEQTRLVVGFAWSIENLERMFVKKRYEDIEAETLSQLIKAMKAVYEDTELIHKTAVKHGLTEMRKLNKKVREFT